MERETSTLGCVRKEDSVPIDQKNIPPKTNMIIRVENWMFSVGNEKMREIKLSEIIYKNEWAITLPLFFRAIRFKTLSSEEAKPQTIASQNHINLVLYTQEE